MTAGDCHPGNVLLLPDGRLGLIDYGQVKAMSTEQRIVYGPRRCSLGRHWQHCTVLASVVGRHGMACRLAFRRTVCMFACLFVCLPFGSKVDRRTRSRGQGRGGAAAFCTGRAGWNGHRHKANEQRGGASCSYLLGGRGVLGNSQACVPSAGRVSFLIILPRP